MKGTNMSDHGFTVAFINDYQFGDNEETEFSPATYAMHWCMTATFINRLFTKEDMYEFLFRLAIVLDTMGLAENWFINGCLFNYRFKDNYYTLTWQQVLAHFGLEIVDSLKNRNPREFYMENIKKGIGNAMISSMFGNCEIIAPKPGADDQKVYNAADHLPQVSDELINKAEFFAQDIMRQVPESHFTVTNEPRLKKLEEIEERKQRIASLPEFDLDLIPVEVRDECMQIMLHPDSYAYYTAADADDEERRDEERRLIYFAWLWANDMMISDGVFAYEVEGVSLDYEDYELEDGGFNLLETYEMYGMEEVKPLLRGVGFKEKK